MAKHIVGPVSAFPPGTRKILEIAGRSIGIFSVDGRFYALKNKCPHQGAALCTGQLRSAVTSDRPGDYRVDRTGEILRCPWHGWEFDLCTGQSWFDPAKVRVKTYEASVEPGASLVPPESGMVPGPYLAETYPVSVEESYLVIEV
jgi:nitrite reductase/ring-hydroxylating ferredoxin subunit